MKHQLPGISCAQCNFKLALLHKLPVCQPPCDVHSPHPPLRAIIRFSIQRQGCKEVFICTGVLKSSTYRPCCPAQGFCPRHCSTCCTPTGPPTTSGMREPEIRSSWPHLGNSMLQNLSMFSGAQIEPRDWEGAENHSFAAPVSPLKFQSGARGGVFCSLLLRGGSVLLKDL